MTHVGWRQPIIHLDMDGVLADLDKGIVETLGVEIDSVERSAFFKSLLPEYTRQGGFETQGKMPRAEELVELCKRLHKDHKYSVAILTSAGQFYLPQSEVVFQKKKWIEREFPWLAHMPFTATSSGADKAIYAHSKAFLVDDHAPNILKFNAAGGFGLVYTPDTLDNDYLATEIERFMR
jgi:5'(3')-deoxyribonucleotidase